MKICCNVYMVFWLFFISYSLKSFVASVRCYSLAEDFLPDDILKHCNEGM